MRPASIVNFERFYLAAIALGLVNTFLSWDSALASIGTESPPGFQFGPGFLWGAVIIGLAIQLLLWYRTARRASVVAKWIIVVLFAYSIGTLALGLVAGSLTEGGAAPLTFALSLLAQALEAVAVFMLFQSDATDWFSGARSEHGPDVFS